MIPEYIEFTDFTYEVKEDSKSEICRRCDSPSKPPTSVSLGNHPIPVLILRSGIDHAGESNENDEYGFFCDLESAKIMEYENVDYYVVKVSKKYEVRRKPLGTNVTNVVSEESITDDEDSETMEKTKGLGKLFACLARLPSDIYYSFMVCTVTVSCVYLVMTI
jgi:hypothetical protein